LHEQITQHLRVRSSVGWGKLGCWRTKVTIISLKRVKMEKKLLWRAYRNSSTLFRTMPFRLPMASYFLRLGVRNPHPKVQSLLSQERVKLRTSNLSGTFIGPSEQKPVKNFGEKAAWAYPWTANMFLDIPYYLRNR